MGMAEFFAMEAGEYLERLDALVSASTAPNAEEFIRLSRALRGSALMANQQPIAGAAAGLEALARALRESKVTWDAGIKQLAIRSVDDIKIVLLYKHHDESVQVKVMRKRFLLGDREQEFIVTLR